MRVCFGRLRSFYSSRVTSAVCTIFTGFAAQSIRRSYPCITLSEQHPAPSGRNAASRIAQQTYEAPYTRSIDQGASTKNLYTSWAVAIAGSWLWTGRLNYFPILTRFIWRDRAFSWSEILCLRRLGYSNTRPAILYCDDTLRGIKIHWPPIVTITNPH